MNNSPHSPDLQDCLSPLQVKSIPITDLQTVDTLWRTASNGRFGYTVQREMWQQAGKRWARFFANIDWVVGENNVSGHDVVA